MNDTAAWAADAAAALSGGVHPPCAAAHPSHRTIDALVTLGAAPVPDVPSFPPRWASTFAMEVPDWRTYRDTHGYCPGDSQVAQSLDVHGVWESFDTLLACQLLDSDPAVVIDFGANVGWYTRLAAGFGHHVLAVEAEPLYLDLLAANSPERTTIAAGWVDHTSPFLERGPRVRLVKSDLEGGDGHAIDICSRLFAAAEVDFVLMEVSPSMGDHYPAILARLATSGYWLFRVPNKGHDPARFAADPLAATLAQPVQPADAADGGQWTVLAAHPGAM